MSQNASTDAPADRSGAFSADLSRKSFRITEPAAQSVLSEDGFRLVKAFLRISSPERREAAIKYVADMAVMDEAQRAL
jgi:hypothetical protein